MVLITELQHRLNTVKTVCRIDIITWTYIIILQNIKKMSESAALNFLLFESSSKLYYNFVNLSTSSSVPNRYKKNNM